MKITTTFLDEISHDIPHQNWGRVEWDTDFAHMKAIGIERAVLIRSGYRRWLTYPSQFLMERCGCHRPSEDLVEMFLQLCEKYSFEFWFGTYDSGHFWDSGGDLLPDFELNLKVIEEVWQRYGHYKSFKGWYLSLELSRRVERISLYRDLGLHCKKVSNNLPVLMSPYMEGKKAVSAFNDALYTGGVSF